ncbi:MAG: AAA family ATPase [Alphaproteobacteria bacterium]|nr:AAA family ATPase [Alphaproteobacteria bacterium]
MGIQSLQECEDEIKKLIRAQFPIIHLNTLEESRALETLLSVTRQMGRHVLLWSTSQGVVNPDTGDQKDLHLAQADLAVAVTAFQKAMSNKKAAEDGMVFVLIDPHPYLNERGNNPIYRRCLKDLANDIREKAWRASCVIISPIAEIPYELEREVTILDFPLPNRKEIKEYVRQFIDKVAEGKAIKITGDRQQFVDEFSEAALGLSQREIENALSYSAIDDFQIDLSDVNQIFHQKQQSVRKSGMLDFIDTKGLSLDDVGGLDRLKRWLMRRRAAFTRAGAEFGLETPKGVLLTGIPGCGKSLSAKCVAASWNMPLLRLDMGRVFTSLVGASEERMRHAIEVAEAVAPCVLWIDEIEKGLVRTGEHIGDSGVSLRVLGTFLTWLQEKTSPVFVVATANEIRQLPSEMLRKGRFDGVFFVDLPDPRERSDILRIHIERVDRLEDPLDFSALVDLAGGMEIGGRQSGMTGAELAAWVDDAMLLAFERYRVSGKRKDRALTVADFEAAYQEMSMIARVRAQELVMLRDWGAKHAQPASDP